MVHCNLDLDSVMVFKTPFGGEHFKLVNFDNARLVGSEVHPVFNSPKDRKEPIVSPEIADTPHDAKRKPELSPAADIWSIGVLCFILRTACLPMNRKNTSLIKASPKPDGTTKTPNKFDVDGIINSPQYAKIFDED